MDMKGFNRRMDSKFSSDSTDHDRAINVLSGLDREAGIDSTMDNDTYAMVREHQEFSSDERGLRKIIGSKSKRK
ncbi:MAG: hypothetical protein J6O04_12460 [Selenomonadaceae bacterium]|nr:hypothetical protein [Selenomonadaceae bacterium]